MKYTKEERLEIGKQIYKHELSFAKASLKYDINVYTARDYMRMYRDYNDLGPRSINCETDDFDYLNSLNRNELINEIIKIQTELSRFKN